jgi:hypothetical protein
LPSDEWAVPTRLLHERYTALDGGEALRQQVIRQEKVKKYSGHRLLSLRQEFFSDWQNLIRKHGSSERNS